MSEVGGEEACKQTERAISLDTSTSLGVTPAQVLAWLAGQHHETLLWQDDVGTFGPEHGRSEVTIDVEPIGTPTLTVREPKTQATVQPSNYRDAGTEAGDADAAPNGAVEQRDDDACQDYLGFDTLVHLSTAGGALDETFPVKFLSVLSDTTGGTGSIPLAGLQGTFNGTLLTSGGAPPGSAANVLLALRISSFGFAGELYVPGVAQSDGYGLAFAHFPADDFCGVFDFSIGKNESVHGLSISGALDSLNAASPVVRNGDDQGTLNLAFESLVDRACTTAGMLSFPARARRFLPATAPSMAAST